MPRNKQASFRYRVINNCLRNTSRIWTVQELIDEIGDQLYEHFGIDKGISLRTFRYDIELMRSLPPRGFDAPIKIENNEVRYEDPNYSIDHSELSETDIEAINDALRLLKNFPRLSINEELALVQAKFQGDLLKNDSRNGVIAFEQKEVKGVEYISSLMKYINDHVPIKLTYKPFQSPNANTFIVHPYLLKQYNHRWYLIGYSSTYKSVGIYALDRIEAVSLSEEKYIRNTFVEVEKYFKDIVGITLPKDENIKDIVLRIDIKQAQYIITKPIHNSQKVIKETDENVEISLQLIPNYEFYSLILSYGNSVEILLPENIRDDIAKKIKVMYHSYYSEQKQK
ncbi:helix-turn-helix transcriptional regulator [Plebeiibacterium marinum]|uniref:WYL domain-containing protein n=1 Tax=Plebeiibacterium marinum TaxID=2992111 RepID=A0AAE3MGF1_9BACT|nr:WYL domain-containing protein [Plebeiobacterium marinum]MCW3807060.1 WYL domain-containing protein [Plebeiobacterium marinum]